MRGMSTQLWWVNPDVFVVSPAMLALLSEAEHAQQQRFIPPKKRHEYLVTRVLVRTVLGRALGVAPQTLKFTANEWGRPALWPPAPLHFNVSHTDGLVVCMVSPNPEMGVDTEQLARAPDLLALAPTVFAPQEQSDLAALPANEQARRAVVLWTLKESYIKGPWHGHGAATGWLRLSFRRGSGAHGGVPRAGRRWFPLAVSHPVAGGTLHQHRPSGSAGRAAARFVARIVTGWAGRYTVLPMKKARQCRAIGEQARRDAPRSA
jgi:4'-phosphopantetheinyl transferase